MVEHREDDEDELPWQVIALLDASILRDLRWSNAYREKRVALALAGEDVAPPLVDTIEGFLDAERALLLEDQQQGASSGGRALAASLAATPAAAAAAGGASIGGDGVNGSADLGAAGWLYRVTAPEAVSLYKKPSVPATSQPAGERPCGALLRVVEVGKGGWLRLAATEKGKLEAPLGLGDAVKVVSGQYAGTNGTVARGLDDKRELGVKLKGYTGTGTFHVTELKRDEKASPAAKKPKKDSFKGYDAYGRRGGYLDGSDSEDDSEDDESEDDEDSEDEEGAVSGVGGAAGATKEVGLWVCLLNESGDSGPPPAQRSKHDKIDTHAASVAGGARLEPVTSSTPLLVAVRSIEAQKLAAAPAAAAATAAAAAATGAAAAEEGAEETGTSTSSSSSSATPAAPVSNNGNSSKDANAKSAAVKAAESGGLVLEERDEAALFDRPFEPRLEAEDATNDDDDADAGADDEDASNSSEAGAAADAAANAAAALAAQVLSPQLGESKAPAAVAAGLAVGTRVVLNGLSAAHYNGREGVVLTTANAEGRQGIRLDPEVALEASGPDAPSPPPEKTLLLKMANLEPCDPEGANGGGGSGAASSADGAVLARAAAVLGVSLAALGLPAGSPSSGNGNGNNRSSVAGHLEVLGAVLRTTDRDLAGLNPSPPTTARAGVSEARRAHRVLAAALALVPHNGEENGGSTAWQAELAPHAVVEQGFLGKRAAQAATMAADPSSFTKIATGVAALRQVLAEEQCRLVRHRGEWQASWGAQVPTWRLEQAEAAAAAALMVDEVDGDLVGSSGVATAQAVMASGGNDAGKALEDGCTGGGSGDCLLLRLCLVRSLLRARRDADALAEAAKAAKLHPCAAPALLWHGRCLLRLGQRDAGFKALSQAATLGANSSVSDYSSAGASSSSSSGGGGCNGMAPPGSRWASREALARVRALKRAKRAELKAKDAYERGKFAEAAQLYTQALAEYDGTDLNRGGQGGTSGAAAAAAAAMGAGDGGTSSVDSLGGDDKWGRAEALVARAGCLRRGRELGPAIADCDAALVVFPKYARALFRRALCLLESAKPTEALATLEKLLRVDRTWPRLLDWLIRASAQARRQAAQGNHGGGSGEYSHAEEDNPEGNGGGGSGGGNADYYNVLGVPTDATEAQLKRAYRIKSLKAHPDKPGGSVTAFQLVATAYETLSDTEKRQLYDDGVDVKKKKKQKRHEDDSSDSDSEDEDGNKKKSLREEVERKYFPENFKFWPFGDPFVEKRRHDARKAKEAEAKKQKKANPYAAPFRRHFGFGDY